MVVCKEVWAHPPSLCYNTVMKVEILLAFMPSTDALLPTPEAHQELESGFALRMGFKGVSPSKMASLGRGFSDFSVWPIG